MAFTFELIQANTDHTRLGRIDTPHGAFATPVFMPVGTRAVVKTVNPDQVKGTGSRILLGNVYHLALRPGEELIAEFGGLHRFMAWEGAILTDSGGYQVFSLGNLCRLSDDGVTFRSHIDGSRIVFTPERVIEIQRALGSDIMMPLDQCTRWPCAEAETEEAVQRTISWARRSKAAHRSNGQALFGIVQGSVYLPWRERCAAALRDIGFDGYAIGGLSIGEDKPQTWDTLAATTAFLPVDQPRYLMGVGTPEDIVTAVGLGVDMFDCVMPTRNARGGGAFTWEGRLQIRNACHRRDPRPIDERCPCYCCRTFSRGYLHHLFSKKVEEILGLHLLSLHNLTFYQELMAAIREAIQTDTYRYFRQHFLQQMEKTS